VTLAALALLWLSSRLEPRTLLDIAPVYQVFQGLMLSLWYHAASITLRDATRGWSGISVWIVVFPLLIPNTRRKVILATLATAATDPIAMWIHVAAGAPAPSLSVALRALIPSALGSFLAIFLSRIVYDLTVAVRKARDLGSYELVGLLGRGGMGEVWRARHRMLARDAAIKLIRSDTAAGVSRDHILRFEREARATAALRSPHTVEVYDFGTTEDGDFYYVMELLTGLDADTLVRRHGPVPPERVVHLLVQVCRSLGEAHARGLVHRDIKPANIFVCRYGLEYDFVKVLDFGLVKSLGPAEDPALTATGIISGTPDYMPPEIARGESRIDHRADLYSLGCVAYRLLSGRPVFEASGPLEVMIEHVRTPPRRPSSASGLPIPPALEDIVMDCLRKEPADRLQSAAELARRLEALALERWTQERAQEWWRAVAPSSPDVSEAETRAERPGGRIVAPAP
jgi:serine/threonine-protein kinase